MNALVYSSGAPREQPSILIRSETDGAIIGPAGINWRFLHTTLRRRKLMRILVAILMVACNCTAAGAAPTLNVGSKRFTESYILGEIITRTSQAAGEATAVHQRGLGNTAIVLSALSTGSIDVYPEYTGTIAREILKLEGVPALSELNAKLAPMGLAASVPLGFNNTYALAMRGDAARAKGIAQLSDLKGHA